MKIDLKSPEFTQMMEYTRLLGDTKYPTPMRTRKYVFPGNYPSSVKTIQSILDPLGLFLFGLERRVPAHEMEFQTAAFMTRHAAWKCDHPMYLVTPALAKMLMATDRLDEPDLNKDSKPPFKAGHFVLPKHLVGTDQDTYVISISYAVLEKEDFDDTCVRPPNDMGGQRFYITCEMNSGESYFAKLHMTDGIVENPEESEYAISEIQENMMKEARVNHNPDGKPTEIIVQEGTKLLDAMCNMCLAIFTYLNLDRAKDTVSQAEATGKAKAKGNTFWKPAMIGLGLTVTGTSTQGNHASPFAHLRRGHWRWQNFGKGLSQRRRIWIEPTLVNPNNK